jgi:hypothetical protein
VEKADCSLGSYRGASHTRRRFHERSNARTVLGEVDLAHVKQIVKGAYQNAKKIATQGDRVLLQGASHGWTVEMWLNVETKVLETAYPVL